MKRNLVGKRKDGGYKTPHVGEQNSTIVSNKHVSNRSRDMLGWNRICHKFEKIKNFVN
jgi:hypothetical protein